MNTLDLIEIVQNCPVLRLDADVNEVGEDCEGCQQHDPDRAELCARMFRGETGVPDDNELWATQRGR